MNLECFQKSIDFCIKGEWSFEITDVNKAFICEIPTKIDKSVFLKLEIMQHKFITIVVYMQDLVHPIELSVRFELQSEFFESEKVFSKLFFSPSRPERFIHFSIERDALKKYVFDGTTLKINYEIEHKDAMDHVKESFSRFIVHKLPSSDEILDSLNLSVPSYEKCLPPRLMYKVRKSEGCDSLIEAFFSIVYGYHKLFEELNRGPKDNEALAFVTNCKSINEFNVQSFKKYFKTNIMETGNNVIKKILENICDGFDEDKFTVNELIYRGSGKQEKNQFFLEVNFKKERKLDNLIETNYENNPTITKGSVKHYPEFLFILIDSMGYFEFDVDFIPPDSQYIYKLKGIITKRNDQSDYVAYTTGDYSSAFTKHDKEDLEMAFEQIQGILKDENPKEYVKVLFYARTDKLDVTEML